MKAFLATLGLAALLGPAPVLAQQSAAPPTAAQAQSRMAEFRQLHERMEALHAQARAQMLASISPAHKAALANLIGQLAIAPNPNADATARQIDALLTPAESQSVVRIHDSLRSQMRSLMDSVRAQMRLPGAPEHAYKPHPEGSRPVDAGHILLMLAAPIGPHGMMMHPDLHPGM